MRRNRLSLLAILAVLAAGACGGDSGNLSLSDDRKVATLDEAGKRELCDWLAGVWGGYAKEHDCGGGVSVSFKVTSQAACVADHARCEATVKAVKDCATALFKDKCTIDVAPQECRSLPANCN